MIDLECVVVDDGSTDRTGEVVRRIADADPRVVVITLPENGGVSNARNRGLEVVRGEWLTLLDADDRFHRGGLAALHRAATERDALAVVGQQVWSRGGRRWIGPLYDIADIRRPGRKSLVRAPGLLYYASPHGKLFRRSLVEDLRFHGRVLGDQPWVVRGLIRAGDRLEVIGDTVYDWIRAPSAGAGPSITAATRSSVRRGVEAAGVATEALGLVRDELERLVPSADDRMTVLRAYVGRLLRSDLAAHLSTALARRDPEIAELYSAVEGFLASVPAAELEGVDALAQEILEPSLRRWGRIRPQARPAFWALAAVASRAQPDVARHGRSRVSRWVLGRVVPAESDGTPRGYRIAIGLLVAEWVARTVALAPRTLLRRLRRTRRAGPA
jgi:hypothetical protein